MGLGRGDVLAVEMPVEIDGGVDLLHDGAGTGSKPTAPHFVAHRLAFGTTTLRVHRPMTESSSPSHARRRIGLIVVAGLAGVAVGMAGVYGIATLGSNA